MKEIVLYTDGSCSKNPGPGGWGAILQYKQHKLELSGGKSSTTNNQMELTGVIEGLKALNEPCKVDLYTDSQYIVNAINKGWLNNWQKNGWKKSDKSPVLNKELWLEIIALFNKHEITVHWVKGHAENEYNNRCDQLAVAQTKKYADLV
ncbi:MAG: ribonuclease HI [Clostridia bacterium]|nr:ribonuclease HI [Clostridia bacterium]